MRTMPRQSSPCLVYLLMAALFLLSLPSAAQAAPAADLPPAVETAVAGPASYLPKPGLRLSYKGILGSDGTTYEETAVTARLGAEALVTYAETELRYFEYSRNNTKPPIDASDRRMVKRYQYGANGGVQLVKVAGSLKMPELLVLPAEINVGVRWNTPWGQRMELIATDATAATAAGRFEHCLVVERDVYAAATAFERYYYAPGMGLVFTTSHRGANDQKGSVWRELIKVEPIDEKEAAAIIRGLL